jgi:hypothetical protein
MDENIDHTEVTSSGDESYAASDAPGEVGDVVEARAIHAQPEHPLAGGEPGNRQDGLMWLFAGALMVGIVILGIVALVVLTSGQAKQATPTLTRAIVYTTSTPRPTATRTPTPTTTPTITPKPTPTPEVILLGVRALGELNTVEYNLKTVVEKEEQQPGRVRIGGIEIWRPRVHFLLVAGGQVKAGVDFREMVRYEILDDKVTVYLPAPRITDYAVDARDLKLYYIHTSFGLDERFVVEKYNEAVVEAQDNLRSAALESDILEVAKTNAAALVQSLILGLGFSEVEVRFAASGGEETSPLEVPPKLIPTLAPFMTATPGG